MCITVMCIYNVNFLHIGIRFCLCWPTIAMPRSKIQMERVSDPMTTSICILRYVNKPSNVRRFNPGVREKAVEAMVELMTHLTASATSSSSKKKSLSLSSARLESDLAIMSALVDEHTAYTIPERLITTTLYLLYAQTSPSFR